MHTWRYNHLMMRTTNPIEICMSSLCRRMSGLGCARSEPLQSLPHLGDVDDSANEEKRG